GDWYLLKTPQALQRFGTADRALLTRNMIEILGPNGAALVGFDPSTALYLFAAQDVDPGPGVQIEPVESPVGVPEFYLLHVLNPKLVLTATAPPPANGALGGVATFALVVDGGTPVTVTVPLNGENGTSGNQNLADLLQDLNGALAAA